MSKTNSWLCTYAIAQLGKPYKLNWHGAFAKCTQKKYRQSKHKLTGENDWHKNPYYGENVKYHDCAGLALGALMCSGVNSSPKGNAPISSGASSIWANNCKNKHTSMSGFDKVPGRLVFVKNTKKNKNKYPYSHVGIYVGTFTDKNGTHTDAVIEALGKDFGVVYSKVTNSKWGAWAQISCCKEDTKVGQTFAVTNTLNPQDLIKVDTFSPYVAIIHPTNTKIDYAKLKESKVSAMMFNAGSLYDLSHRKKTYKNPYLDSQVKGCTEANLPFALYADVRATSEIEADDECRSLYYIISEHPPKLGIWLHMVTGQGVTVNDKVINVYYKYIEKWGLKGKCGIYIDMKSLSTISWSSFQDKFNLLGIGRSLDLKKVENKLLQPSMFEVPD